MAIVSSASTNSFRHSFSVASNVKSPAGGISGVCFPDQHSFSIVNLPHQRSTYRPGAPIVPRALISASPYSSRRVETDGELSVDLERSSPLEIIDRALEKFGSEIAIAFSGAEDVALIEYARLTGRSFRVFSLDTGRLNPETYRFFDRVEKHYGIRIEYAFPEAKEVEELVKKKGLFSFYEEGHRECCGVRKVRPLKKALKGLKAWITGQRKDQSPGTRGKIPVVEVDASFEGVGGGEGSLVKWNPLANVKGEDVWSFLRTMKVPVNELHSEGYVSIGCEPCTRSVLPGQHEREGRWWWEAAVAKECGLHNGSAKPGVVVDGIVNGVVNGSSSSPDLFNSGSVVSLTRIGVQNLAGLRHRSEPWVVVLYAPWCRFCQAMESSYVEFAEKMRERGVRVGKFRADGEDKEMAKEKLRLSTFPTLLFFSKHSSPPVKYPSEQVDYQSLMAFVKSFT